ncbi:hypothetical protein ACFL4A_01000 [bacterium]
MKFSNFLNYFLITILIFGSTAVFAEISRQDKQYNDYVSQSFDHINKKEYPLAERKLRNAIFVKSAEPVAYKLLAMLYETQNESFDAIKAWNDYIMRLDPSKTEEINDAQKHIERLEGLKNE